MTVYQLRIFGLRTLRILVNYAEKWWVTQQMFLMIIYGLYVKQERVPKEPYPEPGKLDKPEIMDMVQPFKRCDCSLLVMVSTCRCIRRKWDLANGRYPPGFDNYFGSDRYNEYKVQEHYSSFMQINIFIFLSLPWSFSFLRKTKKIIHSTDCRITYCCIKCNVEHQSMNMS